MKLHFEEPKDYTRENSAIFEFFANKEDDSMQPKLLKGKSLARLIEERKISNYYKKKKDIRKDLKLLNILVIFSSIICLIFIIFLLTRPI